MSGDLKALLQRIAADSGVTDPEKLMLVSRVTVDAAALQARALAGENVEAEVQVVLATAVNLDEHVRKVISVNLASWLQELLARALGIALVGA